MTSRLLTTVIKDSNRNNFATAVHQWRVTSRSRPALTSCSDGAGELTATEPRGLLALPPLPFVPRPSALGAERALGRTGVGEVRLNASSPPSPGGGRVSALRRREATHRTQPGASAPGNVGAMCLSGAPQGAPEPGGLLALTRLRGSVAIERPLVPGADAPGYGFVRRWATRGAHAPFARSGKRAS